LPPTAELFLAPAPRRRGEAPGAGWLLGLHAPAGASFGRYLHALGAPLERACHEIAAATGLILAACALIASGTS